MKILAVTPRIPWPLDTGGKIRTFRLLKALAKKHEVALVSFDTLPATVAGPLECHMKFIERVYRPEGPVTRAMALARGLRGPVPFTVEQYRSKAMVERLAKVAQRFSPDLVYLDSLHMAQYREVVPLVPAVLDEHNVESLLWYRVAALEPNRFKRIVLQHQASLLRAYEAERVRVMDRVLACSEEDRLLLRDMAGLPWGARRDRIWVVPNGVDPDAFHGDTTPASLSGRPLVFVGSMDWAPNEDGAVWFAAKIMPRIVEQVPEARFYVVGRNPGKALASLNGKDQVVVVGEVPDVRPYLLAAHVVPVPLRSGGGTRLKILEAMAAGKPVVSTTIGAEGLELTPGKEIEIADTEDGFVAAVVRLLRDEERSSAMGKAGAKAVARRYSWKKIGKALAKRLAELGQGAA